MIIEKSKDEVKELPSCEISFSIHVLDHDDDLDFIDELLRRNEYLGFDLEHPPVFRSGDHKPATIIQLAEEEDVYLIQLLKFNRPDRIFQLIRQAACDKIGLALHDDLKYFDRLMPAERNRFVDLAAIAGELGLQRRGLRSLTGSILGCYVSKNQQTSNWAASELSPAQKRYAAMDAWLPLQIFNTLSDRGYI